MIDYYGEKDNYIHLKFGRAQKRYNFTEEFMTQYPEFTAMFTNYFMKDDVTLEDTKGIINHAYDNNIPVHFYYNFTDTPATSREEIISYLDRENN
jgi:hypothetical protein